MYCYQKLTSEEKQKIIQERRYRGYPLYSPLHQIRDRIFYLITASCYKHQCYLNKPDRRQHSIDRAIRSKRNYYTY
jgi:putative transposase